MTTALFESVEGEEWLLKLIHDQTNCHKSYVAKLGFEPATPASELDVKKAVKVNA